MLHAVLEIVLSLLAVFGLLCLGWLTFKHILAPGDCGAPVYTVIPAKGDGAALEQTVRSLLWLRAGEPRPYTVVIADVGLDRQGLAVATTLANEEWRVVLCPMETLTDYLVC